MKASKLFKLSVVHNSVTVKKRNTQRQEELIVRAAVVPFYQTVTNRLTRLLCHRNLRIVSFPLIKLKQHLRPVKALLGLEVLEVYKVPCECGESYIGQTGQLVSIRISEHRRDVKLGQTDKSAVAQHCWAKGLRVLFAATNVLY